MSIEDKNLNCKMIVLDTQTYAGNFERQLCAYVTGQTADCGVGSEIAQVAKKEIKNFQWWEDNIAKQETQ